MHVLVTGAAGYIGSALIARLLAPSASASSGPRPIARLSLLDRGFTSPPVDRRVTLLPVDMADAHTLQQALAEHPADLVFHLASIPGGSAEQHYEQARRVNLDATTVLLEQGRAQVLAGGRAPVFVFASTIAVFGATTGPVDEDTPARPQLSYGAHKLIGETLVADFSRRGWVDGRSLRLPGVLARPPAPTGQLSAFLSNLIRELAAGRPFTCPTSAGATTWASSLPCVLEQLLHAAALPAAALAGRRCHTLPTSRFSMAELVEAIATVHGPQVRDLVSWQPDERIEALFGRFPALATPVAESAGFRRDADLPALVRAALAGG